MSRVDGSFPINLNWTTYVSTFGNIMNNFWIGLESMYQLTKSAPVTLRIEILLSGQ